jgi:hypothetical protein
MNPYKKLVTRNGQPLEAGTKDVPRALGINGTGKEKISADPMVNKSGEFNAHNKQEIIANIKHMQTLITSGSLTSQESFEIKAARNDKLRQALKMNDSRTLNVIGETLASDIRETMGREGFTRKVGTVGQLKDGQLARFRLHRMDVSGVMQTNDPKVPPVIVKQKWMHPNDFYLLANIQIEEKEIHQNTGDLLDEKYNDGLMATMVEEDRKWREISLVASKLAYDELYFGTFTPSIFSELRTNLSAQGNTAVNCILSYDLWDDIITDTEFSTWFDPVHKYNLILEGNLGNILGVNLITDGFRHKNLRVLNQGEIFMYVSPDAVGGVQELLPVEATSTNRHNQGEPYRGWFFKGIEAMAIVNHLGVIHGQRVL